MQLPTLALLASFLALTSASSSDNDLTPRDGVGAAAGAVPAPSPTQMSPATTYMVHGPGGALVPVPYTQVFVAVPDPWPAPTAGTIGLGTIQGVIGVVRTASKVKRAEPTGLVGGVIGFARSVVERSGDGLEKREGDHVRGGGRVNGGYDTSYSDGASGSGGGTRKQKADNGVAGTSGAGKATSQKWSVGFAAASVILGVLVML